MATRMQQRRGTAAQWISTNGGAGPVLNAGEMGWESDTNKFKIGDGVNNWTSLDYFSDINSTVNPAFGSSITFEGATANDFETTLAITDPTADRTITIPDVTGTVITTGNLSDITNIGVFTSTIVMEGSSADDFELTLSAGNPTADRTITFPDSTGTVALTTDIAAGTVTETGTQTLTNKTLTSPIVTGLVINDGSIVVEGSAADAHETTLVFTNPTEDRTITFPNASFTVASTADISAATGGSVSETGTQTLTNKTLTSPTLGGTTTTASGNLAVQPATYILEVKGGGATEGAIQLNCSANTHGQILKSQPHANAATNTLLLPGGTTIGNSNAVLVSDIGTQTLTNKTLTSPTISGLTLSDGSIVIEGATADAHETTLSFTDPTADRTITFPDATGTVALAANVAALSGATFTGAVSGTDLTLSGNLTVNGTTTNINSTNLVVEDKNIILADVETPTDVTADGGGITLKGTTDKTFNWVDSTDSWTSSEHINLASGKSYSMNGTALKDVSETLTNKTLTTPVISSISNTGTLTLPTSTDTLVGRATTDTLTNKSISLTTNTLSGSLAEFNSALSGDDFVSLTGSETLTNKTLGSAVATTAFTLNATAELRLADTDSSHYVGFKSPGTVAANKIWTLPAADGSAGQTLSTDGSATLSWSTPAAGAAFSELMLIGA